MANVSFSGNVVRPDLRFTKSGKAVFSCSVPENHQRKNADTGAYEDSGTTWWRVNFWGNKLFTPEALAEAVGEGAFVNVIGRSETRSYEKDGEKRDSLEVNADTIGVMPKAPKGGAPQQSAQGGAWSNTQQPQQAPQGAWGNQNAPAPTWGQNTPQNGAQQFPAPF